MRDKSLTQSTTGNFGNLAHAYASGRMGIPNFIMEYLWSLSHASKPSILDIGCGTGIPTRQLAESGAQIFATDIDAQMIKSAEETPLPNINYFVAPTNNLPFSDNNFDIATIFSALHWFATNESILEIKRVLKPDGLIFILNKNDIGDFWSGHRSIMEKYAGGEITKIKKDYNPFDILNKNDFENTNIKDFEYSEWYSLYQALEYLQSISAWNLIPQEHKPAVLSELENYCSNRMVDSKVERKLKITVCSGYKIA